MLRDAHCSKNSHAPMFNVWLRAVNFPRCTNTNKHIHFKTPWQLKIAKRRAALLSSSTPKPTGEEGKAWTHGAKGSYGCRRAQCETTRLPSSGWQGCAWSPDCFIFSRCYVIDSPNLSQRCISSLIKHLSFWTAGSLGRFSLQMPVFVTCHCAMSLKKGSEPGTTSKAFADQSDFC